MYRNTYVEIDLDIIENNIKNIIKKYNDYNYYIGVVKGNAYGHGSYIAKTLVENGINYLAVATLDEALEVRKFVNVPILCLEPINIKYIPICISNNITITLSSYSYFKELVKNEFSNLKIHLKLNTGFNRLGIDSKDEVLEIYNYFKDNKNIELEGIYTHFATSGIIDTGYDDQVNSFLELTSLIDLKKIKIIHLERSSTIEFHPKLSFANGVRLGIIMYGVKQKFISYDGLLGNLRKVKHNYLIKKNNISTTFNNNNLEIKNAFKLKSEIVEVRPIKKGNGVGYGYRYHTEKDAFIAIVLIGYSDGINLKYTNNQVKINDKFYPIVGAVNMGMLTILVDENVKVGDMAYIIDNNISELARNTETTPHVIMTSINKEIERVYIKNGKVIERNGEKDESSNSGN